MWAIRKVMTRVLPVPAPAKIKTGPLIVSAAWRCCGFRELRLIMRGRSLDCKMWTASRSRKYFLNHLELARFAIFRHALLSVNVLSSGYSFGLYGPFGLCHFDVFVVFSESLLNE